MHLRQKVFMYRQVRRSGTLKAIGVSDELLDSTIRFSFSVETTKEQVEYALEVLKKQLPILKRFIKQ